MSMLYTDATTCAYVHLSHIKNALDNESRDFHNAKHDSNIHLLNLNLNVILMTQ